MATRPAEAAIAGGPALIPVNDTTITLFAMACASSSSEGTGPDREGAGGCNWSVVAVGGIVGRSADWSRVPPSAGIAGPSRLESREQLGELPALRHQYWGVRGGYGRVLCVPGSKAAVASGGAAGALRGGSAGTSAVAQVLALGAIGQSAGASAGRSAQGSTGGGGA